MAEVKFVQLPTGRTHQARGVYEQILDANGNPETEWALVAEVNGHRVVLETFSNGYVDHMVGRADTALNPDAEQGATGTHVQAPADAPLTSSGVASAPAPQVTEEKPSEQPAEPAEPAAPAPEGSAPQPAEQSAAPAEPQP